MDQNNPPNEGASGQVPPASSDGGQGATWDSQQQPGADPPVNPVNPGAAGVPGQGVAGVPGQGATAEYAAWSTDATYQNPDESGQPASQAPDASTAYAAPEPQAVTYQEQPPQDQASESQDQPQGYEQQQLQQAAYDQQQQQYAQQVAAYEQQQAAYAQQQQQQQQYAQPQQSDQQTYEQQQQAYAQQQQQQAYDPAQQQQQQQAYDPAQQQQAYDPAQQQQGYYQQPPQGYQQQQYQQPTQPYAYAQPNQQGWPADQNYWEQEGAGYGRSFLAVLSGFVLLTWGVMLAVGGALLMFLDNVADVIADVNLPTETQKLVDEAVAQQVAIGGAGLMLGILMVIGAVGIWAHRGWGRAVGVLLGLIGTVAGIGMVISSLAFEVGDVSVDGALAGEAEPLGAALVVFLSFLLVFLAMFVGKRHFRKKGVSDTPPAAPA